MSELQVHLLPQLQDNYSYIVVCTTTKAAAIVDCPKAEPMIQKLEELGVEPQAILNTHHHWDHIGGNKELLARWPRLRVYGHISDKARIPGLTRPLQEGDRVEIGEHSASVLFTPGHTNGHITYWFEEAKVIFAGDVLFAGGCGRVFEGTPTEMYHSIAKVAKLDRDAKVYCGHEYTLSNLRFALTIEPDNEALQQRLQDAAQKREQDQPTIPFTLAEEWNTNPFVRVAVPAVQETAAALGADIKDPASVFAAIRKKKDEA